MRKVDCSITKNYLKEKARLLKPSKESACTIRCEDCPFGYFEYNCSAPELLYPQEAIEIMQKWSDEHPVKTRLDDLMEKYPKVELRSGKIPNFCCRLLGYKKSVEGCCDYETDCIGCWNTPLNEVSDNA